MLLTLVTTNLYAADISIENSRIRMMPPGVPMTAGYFLILNNTNKDKDQVDTIITNKEVKLIRFVG